MKIALAVALVLAVPAPLPAVAQEPGPDQARCEAHVLGIDATAKELSWQWASSSSERSALRLEVAMSEILMLASLINAKVTAMAADGCGGYHKPIGPNAYSSDVQACRQANGNRTDLSTSPVQCDRATWTPDPGSI